MRINGGGWLRTRFDERRAERDDLIIVVECNVGNSVGDWYTVLSGSIQNGHITHGANLTYNLLLNISMLGSLSLVSRLVQDTALVKTEMAVHEGHGGILKILRRALRKRVIYAISESLPTKK